MRHPLLSATLGAALVRRAMRVPRTCVPRPPSAYRMSGPSAVCAPYRWRPSANGPPPRGRISGPHLDHAGQVQECAKPAAHNSFAMPVKHLLLKPIHPLRRSSLMG